MHTVINLVLATAIGISSSTAVASEKLITGVFDGTGRACSGSLQIRAKTIEWRSAFSTCKPTPYEVLEKNAEDGPKRIVFRLKKSSRQCLYPVIEVTHASDYRWNVTGYQSLEGFQKKEAPDWSNSPLPERQTLSCPMTGPN